MAISVECSQCGYAYQVDEQFIGQRAKCRKCGKTFTVEPGVAPPPSDLVDPFANAVFEVPAEAPAGPKRWNAPVAAHEVVPPARQPAYQSPPAILAGRQGAGRGVRSVGLDPLTPYALFLLILGTIVSGLIFTFTRYGTGPDPHATNALIGHVWGWLAVCDVLFFLIVGPSVLGGAFAASKILGMPMADMAYFRACGVAALPTLLINVALLLPQPFEFLVFLSAVPIAVFMYKQVFEFAWSGTAVGFLMSFAGYCLGWFVTSLILGAVVAVSIETLLHPTPSSIRVVAGGNPISLEPGLPVPAQSAESRAFAQFKKRVLEETSADLSQSTREERTPEVQELKEQMQSLGGAFQGDPEWAGLAGMVENFDQRVAALPSGQIDPSIMTDAADAENWTAAPASRGKLAPEISFFGYKIQPPAEAKIDLRSSEDGPQGLIWTGKAIPGARFSIYSIPRTDPKQRRPLLANHPAVLRIAQQAGLLAIDGGNLVVSQGSIDGLPFSRVAVKAAVPGEHWIDYYTPADDRWIVIHLICPPNNPAMAQVLEAAARTCRLAEAGEARASPFAAKLIAPRLAEDYERVSELLRDQGPSAEPAVAAQIQSKDPLLRRRAVELLQETGTEASVPALRQAALDQDATIAILARAAIRRIQPAGTPPSVGGTTMPAETPAAAADLSRTLADLESDDAGRRKDAVAKLPFIAVDEKKLPAVSSRLAGMLRTRDNAVPLTDLVAAMSVWGDQTLATDLLPLLQLDADPDSRHAAMKVLGAIKASSAAPAITRWLKLDPVPTAEALIAIGPGAEAPVIPPLLDGSATVRIDAARILARIGSRKALENLRHAAADPRDPAAREAAQAAIDAIKLRSGPETRKSQ